MTTAIQSTLRPLTVTWPQLPEDFPLPDDPVENEEHPPLAAALTQPLASCPQLLEAALITSNFALCANVDGRTLCKAPDWMYVRPVKPSQKPRRSYTPHTEGAVPLIVIEFLSGTDGGEYSMESGKKVGKWFFYERIIQIPHYVIFEPASGEIEAYFREGGLYRKRSPNEAGRYWINGLDLFLGVWQGRHEVRTGYWLRWWNAAGELLSWPEERAAQAEQRAAAAETALVREQQEKAQLLERLRAAGIEL